MHKYLIAIVTFLHILTVDSQAQNIPQCDDSYVHEQVVTNNSRLEKLGYKLQFTREMHIPSGGLQPVTVSLKAGQSYIASFIPFLDATNLRMIIVDKERKTIVNKKGKKNEVVSHTFTAPYTGDYYIMVSQKMKKVKEICGGISVMSK